VKWIHPLCAIERIRRNYLEYGQDNQASVCVVDGEHSISCSCCHSILDRHNLSRTIGDTTDHRNLAETGVRISAIGLRTWQYRGRD
jgi:hypothetical protein